MTTLRDILRRAPLAGVLVALLLLFTGPLAAVHAAGSATINDGAGLFTSAGRAKITQTAQNAPFNVLVITNAQSFPTKAAWQSWLRSQATDQNAVTIGLHFSADPHQRNVFVVPGGNTGISQSQADQGVQQALATFNSSQPGHITGGVVQLIQTYKGMSPAKPASGGSSTGWLVPLIVLVVLAFLVMRLLGRRRRTFAPPGYGPGMGGPYQGGYGPNMGSGGGAGRGFLGGLAGGVAGSFIGNELFGNRGGNVNAGGFDQNANPGGATDTPYADAPGGWTGGDAGGASPADSGGWSGGDTGGGWSGGDAGGGGGWDNSGGGDSGGGWT